MKVVASTVLNRNMEMLRFLITVLFLSLTQGFSVNPQLVRGSPRRLQLSTKPISSTSPPKSISYGEESRKFRRTIYSHDDWVKHRSPNRFLRNVMSIAKSGIYKNISNEAVAVTFVATFLVVWNTTVQKEVLSGPFTALTFPMTAFTLSSSSLGLLLGFRTNQAYKRWDEARKNWGLNINRTRDLVRMASCFYDKAGVSDQKRRSDLKHLSLCTWAFVRAMKRHLSPVEDEVDFKKELHEKLQEHQAENIIKAVHRPNRALHDLSMAIEALPMHFLRRNELHAALTVFENTLGGSERLLTSPIPLFYTRHTARSLSLWLVLLPFGLYSSFANTWNHIGLIPATAAISVFLLGIDELATQMEEPFTILPMQGFCDKIGKWCNEIVSWEDGDNGLTTRAPSDRHSSVHLD
ncbi:unnamed protein product [Cylindrotheca closterium]|uniref:Uncharacterized protein n=1 Tax=Cylindrotheca closterium TaxID=2856 RepID=A0AAD2G699_9STRA|nr:unnamed protein product [Cylindrotheca closterium]